MEGEGGGGLRGEWLDGGYQGKVNNEGGVNKKTIVGKIGRVQRNPRDVWNGGDMQERCSWRCLRKEKEKEGRLGILIEKTWARRKGERAF